MADRKAGGYERYLRTVLQDKLAEMVSAVFDSLTITWKFLLEDVTVVNS